MQPFHHSINSQTNMKNPVFKWYCDSYILPLNKTEEGKKPQKHNKTLIKQRSKSEIKSWVMKHI